MPSEGAGAFRVKCEREGILEALGISKAHVKSGYL